MSQVAETLASAREAWASGDAQGSYRELSGLFACFPDVLEGREDFCQAVELLAELTKAFGAGSLAASVARAARNPDDVNALYEAAYGLFEETQFRPAATERRVRVGQASIQIVVHSAHQERRLRPTTETRPWREKTPIVVVSF